MDINYLYKNSKIKLDGYGDNKFVVSGKQYYKPILILPNKIKELKNLKVKEISKGKLERIIKNNKLEFLILGLNLKKKKSLNFKTSLIEIMDTGAACRTINILLAEGRNVGALLFPIKT